MAASCDPGQYQVDAVYGRAWGLWTIVLLINAFLIVASIAQVRKHVCAVGRACLIV